MNDSAEKSGSPQSSRAMTRAQIVATFNRLLLGGERDRPRVAEIVAEAGVARSTFYDHFDGVEALFDESLAILFGALARGFVGEEEDADLDWWMAHIHENRRRGRSILTGPAAQRSEALFARLLQAELAGRPDARLHAILIAGTITAALNAWVTGRLAASPEELGRRLRSTAQAILGAS